MTYCRVVEQYLFPTLKACLDFVAESAEKFKEPSTGSNSPLEASKDAKPVKFKVGDRVKVVGPAGASLSRDIFIEEGILGKIFTVEDEGINGECMRLKGLSWSFNHGWLIPVPKRGRPRKVIS